MSSIFLPTTLTRGSTTFACKGIFEEYGTGLSADDALTASNVKALVLATSLATKPAPGDRFTIRETTFAEGQAFVVMSLQANKPAISIDPAGAVWALRGKAVPVSADIADSYAGLAEALGRPFLVYRPPAGGAPSGVSTLGTVMALFTDGEGSGYNLKRALHFDDILQNAIVDARYLEVGDYLSGISDFGDRADPTYFVVSVEPLRPLNCVKCNRVVSHVRGNAQIDEDGGRGEGLPSQTGGSGRYFGTSREPDTDDQGPGEQALAANVPVALLPLAGAARGQGQVPGDAPGPGRWRAYLPMSVFPLGSVRNRDILIDESGNRYQVATDGWTQLGYRPELIRLEN